MQRSWVFILSQAQRVCIYSVWLELILIHFNVTAVDPHPQKRLDSFKLLKFVFLFLEKEKSIIHNGGRLTFLKEIVGNSWRIKLCETTSGGGQSSRWTAAFLFPFFSFFFNPLTSRAFSWILLPLYTMKGNTRSWATAKIFQDRFVRADTHLSRVLSSYVALSKFKVIRSKKEATDRRELFRRSWARAIF